MPADRYTARIGGTTIAENAPYDTLLVRIVEYTVRAAVARTADRSEWEFEELRDRGIDALEIAHDGKAIWCDRRDYECERAAAVSQAAGETFDASNELDAGFCERLDHDLRARWQRAGYETPSLAGNMRPLFGELERDAADRAAVAQNGLVADITESLDA
ncbi:MAG: hypothetical protein JO199_03660 [Candidatus Eremiobacteraeota bacterium]|nr:hypothetical protein [Candidatus Eremiobacteraeota bacterium]